MKKAILFIILSVTISGVMYAKNIRIEAKARYFIPSEQAFKDIYGSGIMYGGEIGVSIWNNFELWVIGSYFSKKGELTFTGEETKLRILPTGAGIRYVHPTGKTIDIYGGMGICYFSYKEENPIGDVSTSKIGYLGTAGTYVKVSDGLFFDLFIDYSYCKIQPADFSINIGGFGAGVGIGYNF